jgi:hypothetical protein
VRRFVVSRLEAMVVGSAARLGVDEVVLLVVGIVIVAGASMSLVLRLAY